MFLFPLCPSLGFTKALWEFAAVYVSGILGGEVTDGLRTTRPSSGQDQEVGDAEALGFHEGFSLSPSTRPCPSSRVAQGMTETISSFYFWQSHRRGVPLLCLF